MAQSTFQVMLNASESISSHAAGQARLFIIEYVPKAAGAIIENPSIAAGVVLAAAGFGVLAAPAMVSTPALLVFGFGSTGIGTGTLAATAQSTIGNVAAGSIFATLQSAGAGGAGLAAVNGIIQIGGGLITTLGSGITFWKSEL